MNSHRHVFVRKKTPQKYIPTPKAHTFSKVSLNGPRIINFSKLQQYIDDLTRHGTQCTSSWRAFCRQSKCMVLRFIGDGDSSVYPTLVANVPDWGSDIKIECANHACKCYRPHWEQYLKTILNIEEKVVSHKRCGSA